MRNARQPWRGWRASPTICAPALGGLFAFAWRLRFFSGKTKASLARRASRRYSRRSRTPLFVRMPRTTARVEGLLLVDKPIGMTSHDVVAIVRRSLGVRRIGHTGTLDPFATGLLVLLVGQATRLARFVEDEPKVYEATIAFGAETDTDDLTGSVI